MKKLLLFLFVASLVTTNLKSQMINIPDDFLTIQEGINAANDEDTVLVQPGTYYEKINFSGKILTVASNYIFSGDTSIINNTIISGLQDTTNLPGVWMEGAGGPNSSINGFTLDSMSGHYGAMLTNGGTVSHCKIINATSNYQSPGFNGFGTINHCLYRNNSGGGCMIQVGDLNVYNSEFYDNPDIPILCWGSTLNVENSVFANNTGSLSGAIYMTRGGTVNIINSSFFNNASDSTNTAIYITSEDGGPGSTLKMLNCIFWDTFSTGYPIYMGEPGAFGPATGTQSLYLSNNIIKNGSSGINGTISYQILVNDSLSGDDPMFTNPDNYDFTLQNSSPAIGYGVTEVVFNQDTLTTPSTDIDSNQRPNPTGSNPDLGVFENPLGQPEYIFADFSALPTSGEALLIVNFTDLSTGTISISWQWDFNNDGIIDSEEQNPEWIYTEPGTYTVSLTVSDGVNEDTEVKVAYITVNEPEIHFQFEGGNPADPVWTIYLSGATLDGLDLQIMDEIGIFDGETLVGAFTLTEVLTPENQFDNILIAWSTLANGETGYTPGNTVLLRCWDASEGIETANFDITYYNPYGDAYVGEVFPSGDGQYSLADFDFVTTITQFYSLQGGYQFVSSRVTPEDQNMQNICNDILDNLDFVRNTAGLMLRKIGPVWVNSIGNWVTTEGYLIRMNDSDNFEIEGSEIDPQTPINLVYGFQFVSFLQDEPMNAQYAFTDILDNLDFVRNTSGNMLIKIGPNWINSIGDLIPGEGYLVRMNNPDVLIYPTGDEKFSGASRKQTEYFNFDGGNAADPVFTIYFEGLEIGDEVAAYDGEIMIGAMKVNSENAFDNVLPVFSIINSGKGFKTGNPIIIKVWDASSKSLIPFEYTMTDPYNEAYMEDIYPEDDGLYSIIKITKGNNIENANKTISIFPNPSEGIFNISIEGVSGTVQMKIFDVHGNDYRFFEIEGTNSIISEKLDLHDLSAGVYFISFSGKNFSGVKKIVIQ